MEQGPRGSYAIEVLVPSFLVAFYFGVLAFVLDARFGGSLFSSLDVAGWLFVILVVILLFVLNALESKRR